MKKNKLLNGLLFCLQTTLITGLSLFSVANVSCKISAEGLKLIKGDYETPLLENFVVEDATNLRLNFSKSVKLSSCSITEELENQDETGTESSWFGTNFVYSDDDKEVLIAVDQELKLGKKYELFGVVEDSYGNSLTFSIPFFGFNGRVPKIVMTEIQSASVGSQNTKEKAAGTYRNEYIEFLCLESGNLFGLEVLSGYDGEEKKFVFPSVEVKKGEVFVVHLRNRGNGCISENEDDLSLAWSSYTEDGIRDLWGCQEGTLLGNKTDVIIVRNQANKDILDAAFYRDSGVANWTKEMETYASLAEKAGIYDTNKIAAASVSDGLTDTKILYRKDAFELKNQLGSSEILSYPLKAGDWLVGSSTPGIIEQDL